MTKKSKNPFGIFTESIGLYFSNFTKFVKYMTFPVLGQVVGTALILLCTIFYTKNLPFLIEKFPVMNNFNVLILCSIIITLPGMIILLKAFWEYLVAYGAINSMLENMLKSGRVYDFDAHTELIKRRSIPFVGLWTLFGIFSIFAIIPIFWVPAGVLAVFFVLIFQVFTFEPERSPIGCAKKSMQLIKGHFASTFLLIALIGALTYIFIPKITTAISDVLRITNFLSNFIIPFVNQLPLDNLNSFLLKYGAKQIPAKEVATLFVTSTVSQILIQYTLPMRSILWSMWYKELNGGLTKIELPKKTTRKTKTKKISSKRPSEKLMEESHKKFATKKIDRNLLRRAMEKDENQDY